MFLGSITNKANVSSLKSPDNLEKANVSSLKIPKYPLKSSNIPKEKSGVPHSVGRPIALVFAH